MQKNITDITDYRGINNEKEKQYDISSQSYRKYTNNA